MITGLINPCVEYKDSYLRYVEEFVAAGEELVPFPLGFQSSDFEGFLNTLEEASNGTNVSPGMVPHTTFWLVDCRATVVGVSNLRHRLNDRLEVRGGHIGFSIRPSSRGKGFGKRILSSTLSKASDIGIKEVLVTCDRQNLVSAAVIKACGGVFEDEVLLENSTTQRYRINLHVSCTQ